MKVPIRVKENTRGGYTASCPDLPGCFSQGQTQKEACDRLDEAIRGYMAALNNFVPDKVDHEVVEA